MTETQTDQVTDQDVNDAAIFGAEGDEDQIGSEQPPAGTVQTGTPAPATVDDLITDEEYNQLASNPAELRKLARERHNERMSQHSDVLGFKKAYDEDPVTTVTNLARRLGILKDSTPTPAQPSPAQPTLEQVVYARFSKALGPQLAAEMTPIILEVSRAMAEQAVGPIQQNLRQTSEAAQRAEASRIVSSYFEKNPDAVAHQEGMFKLMEKFPPGKGVSDEEWLDLLHREAVRVAGKGSAVPDARKVAASLIKSTVQQIRGSSPASVTSRIPKDVSGRGGNQSEARRLAFEAATRGERWDEN